MKHLIKILLSIFLVLLELKSADLQEPFGSNGTSDLPQIVPVIEGRGVALNCRIHNLGTKRPRVKWLRISDYEIVATGSRLRISDKRFRAYQNTDGENVWTLEIFRVEPKDEGQYECQVSTDNPSVTITKKFKILVEKLPMYIEPSGKIQVFEEGSTIELACVFHNKPAKNKEFWYYVVNRRAKKVGEIETLRAVEIFETNPVIKSVLLMTNASHDQQGEYLCKPDNKWVTWVSVNVVPKEIVRSSALNNSASKIFEELRLLNTFLLAALVFMICQKAYHNE